MDTHLITSHKDYWLLIQLNPQITLQELNVGEYYVEHTQVKPDRFEVWRLAPFDVTIENCHKLFAHLPKHKEAPLLENIPFLPPYKTIDPTEKMWSTNDLREHLFQIMDGEYEINNRADIVKAVNKYLDGAIGHLSTPIDFKPALREVDGLKTDEFVYVFMPYQNIPTLEGTWIFDMERFPPWFKSTHK